MASRTKNKNPSLNSNFYTKSELMGYYVKDINIILKNRNIWIEYICTNPTGDKKLTKINFIISKNFIVTLSPVSYVVPIAEKTLAVDKTSLSQQNNIILPLDCIHSLAAPLRLAFCEPISLYSLSIDCINLIISGNIEIFSKLNATSKTMHFINESDIPLRLLEPVVGYISTYNNPYVSRAQITSGFVWLKRFHPIAACMCIMLTQPNHLSKIYKSACFVTHRLLVLEFLNALGIWFWYEEHIFIETFLTHINFCVPTMDIDLRHKIDHNEYMSRQNAADNLCTVFKKQPERIVGPMIHDILVSKKNNNKNKTLDTLFALIEHDASATINVITCTSPYKVDFYSSLGTFPNICKKIVDTKSRDIPKIFVLSLERHDKLLLRYVCLVHEHEGEKGVRKIMRECKGSMYQQLSTKVYDIFAKYIF